MDVFKSNPPASLEYRDWGDPGEFDEHELKEISDQGVQALFYWYVRGGYEGAGQLLLLKDSSWYVHDCGHCSCYGPIERLTLSNPVAGSLAEIQGHCTDGHWEEVKPLVLLASEKGYGVLKVELK